MGEDYVMKIADFGLARHTRDMDYYRKTTDVSHYLVRLQYVTISEVIPKPQTHVKHYILYVSISDSKQILKQSVSR